jgi:16S rRNA (uracil1498-N3)-methyltransferase
MPKFFVEPENINPPYIRIFGDDAAHITKALRMGAGDEITVSDGNSTDYFCRIESVAPGELETAILRSEACRAEPQCRVTLYMALAKSDKLELVVQKATELGAARVRIFKSSRCVPDPNPKAVDKRMARLRKIAREAAGQSLRGIIPDVDGVLSFADAVKLAAQDGAALFFYEKGGASIKSLLGGTPDAVSVMVGPEGGFSPEEVKTAADAGMSVATLGPRILRCETAAMCAVTTVLYEAGEYDRL